MNLRKLPSHHGEVSVMKTLQVHVPQSTHLCGSHKTLFSHKSSIVKIYALKIK